MTIGTKWPSFIHTAPPLAVSIRLTIAPEARTPRFRNADQLLAPRQAKLHPIVARGAKFEAERPAMPDPARQLEEAFGIERRRGSVIAGEPLGGLFDQRDHVRDALRAVGAQMLAQARTARARPRRPFAATSSAGLSCTADSTSATMPLVIAALLSARKCRRPSSVASDRPTPMPSSRAPWSRRSSARRASARACGRDRSAAGSDPRLRAAHIVEDIVEGAAGSSLSPPITRLARLLAVAKLFDLLAKRVFLVDRDPLEHVEALLELLSLPRGAAAFSACSFGSTSTPRAASGRI